jgi:hypothetical protein
MSNRFYKPKNLLSIDADAKTIKGNQFGYKTGILYLAPSDLSGVQLCPMAALAGCAEGCLYSAGRGAFSNVQAARINKTHYFLDAQQEFMQQLAKEIKKLAKDAAAAGAVPVVRLNGTSDIRFENIHFEHEVAGGGVRTVTIFEAFPEIQFMDYTKLQNRKRIPKNYDLTFSFSGREEFTKENNKAIANGMRVAVVFRKAADIPSEFRGMQTMDGDESDLRFLEPQGVVSALYAKGRARLDTSGFVV